MIETTEKMKIFRKILMGLWFLLRGIFVIFLIMLLPKKILLPLTLLMMFIAVIGIAYMIGDMLTDFE